MDEKRGGDAAVDTRPDYIKKAAVSSEIFKHEDIEIRYTVTKRELNPDLSGYVGRDSKTGDYLISEEVPLEYRRFYILHEYFEYEELEGEDGRCVKALRKELELIPEYMRGDYIDCRLDFFERLVAFYANFDDADFRREIQGSLDYLKSLMKE